MRNDGIYGADLDATATTDVAEVCRLDVIVSIWGEEWQSREPLDNLFTSLRSREPLQQLLQNQAGRQ